SAIAAVVGCAIAFFVFNRATVKPWLVVVASIFMGLAIAAMHYTGMAGMRMNRHIFYNSVIVGASIAVAIAFSLAALAFTRNLVDRGSEKRLWIRKTGAAILLGSAVSGMHYTGLAGATFTRGAPGWKPTDDLVLGTFQLGLVVAVISVALLVVALFATQFERWTIATRSKFENL